MGAAKGAAMGEQGWAAMGDACDREALSTINALSALSLKLIVQPSFQPSVSYCGQRVHGIFGRDFQTISLPKRYPCCWLFLSTHLT